MAKKITEDQSKLDLVSRLVKDGAIDFNEALKLLEVEQELQTVSIPSVWPDPTGTSAPWWGVEPPYRVTCRGDEYPFTYTN